MNCGFNLNFFGVDVVPCTKTTINHFWNADDGDDERVTILNWMNWNEENALQKAKHMWYGSHNHIIGTSFKPSGIADKIDHSGLAQLHNTGVVKWIGYWNSLGQFFSKNYNKTYSTEYRRRVAYSILGRMCHLLADMSVPAHVHEDAHSLVSEDGADGFEDWLKNNYSTYTWVDALEQGGALFDATEKNYPIRYLMYVVNQYTDFFPSEGDWSGNYLGDRNYSTTYSKDVKTDYYPILDEIFSQLGTRPTSINNSVQASHLIPFAIRATAALLYLFAVETDQIPTLQSIESASLIGNNILWAETTGRWSVNLEKGICPFNYNWQIMYLSGIPDLLNTDLQEDAKKTKVKKIKKNDGVIINAAPRNYWLPIGYNSPNFEKPHNPLDLRDFKLRCIVTDASNTTKYSNEVFVDVVSEPPPIAKSNNINDESVKLTSSSNEGSEFTPYEFSLYQNYPNPFNPTTVISYSLSNSSYVSLKIYDSLGKEIAELVNGIKSAGNHEATFDGSSLASGIYFYSLKTDGEFSINKMILIK